MGNSINIKIGGQAGEGIKTTGLVLAKTLSRLGFHLFAYDEYPSLIRGGHNTYQIHASSEPVYSQCRAVDLLIALDEESVSEEGSELKKEALVLFDPDVFSLEEGEFERAAVPLEKIAEEAGSPLSANMAALGAVMALLDLPLEVLEEVVKDVMKGKGEEIVGVNLRAVRAGAKHLQDFSRKIPLKQPTAREGQIVVLGNEAIGAGAISAGMKYFAAYPMTPVTSLFTYLASSAPKYGLIAHHVENEIAAINTLLGASIAGVRGMTATSGGGFSLMVEGVGMAGIAEVPVVIVLGMRPGPATGLPTWTGQGDLRFVIHASQDEFPRLVLTPGSASEAFELTRKAFALAEEFQLPVVLLADKYLLESHQGVPAFPVKHSNNRFGFIDGPGENYLRYRLTDSGVSPRPNLGGGRGGMLANSYEHGQDGLSSEKEEDRKMQTQKRLKKLESLEGKLWGLPVFGSEKAKVMLVGFGSTLGPAREALKDLPEASYLHFNRVWPFPAGVREILGRAERVICLEGNAQGQLEGLIREQSGVEIKESLRKFDGRPFYPEEIVEKVKHG